MKKLFRIAVFAGGAIVLFLGTRTDTRAQYGGACVKQIDSDVEYCASCCKTSAPYTVATYITDPSPGFSSYYTANGSCGGVLDPNSCTSSECGSFQYNSQFQDASCCNGVGGGCSSDADCCLSLICNTYGQCRQCLGNGSACASDADCCTSNCGGVTGICKTGFDWN